MEHFKLLIIGAGASGMAAAVKLLENEFSNFRILEAENRIGGRINTTNLGIVPVELGAEWIHGETGNVVHEMASKYNLTDYGDKQGFFTRTNFFDFSGHQINKEISSALSSALSDILATGEVEFNGSVGNYVEIEFQKIISNLRKKVNVDDNLCKKFFKSFENWQNSIDGSHSWYETSLMNNSEYWECPGNIVTRWKNNRYNTLFKLMTENLLDDAVTDKILFNKEVCTIRWNEKCEMNSPNVEVHCSDGSKYFANHLLLTCSLGVLKDRALKMFCPQLPSKKLLCIQNLGFGTVNKIFLKFSHRWWSDSNGFAFLWSESERQNDCSGWLNGVICFHPISADSAILRGWVTGEAAQYMESLTNCEIAKGLNYLFDKFLGLSYQVQPIEVCMVSKWFTNPHFRGSYSCRLTKSDESNVWASDLAEPVTNVRGVPILLFGGEASHDHFYSTVHGAIEAGQREANRILPLVSSINYDEKFMFDLGDHENGITRTFLTAVFSKGFRFMRISRPMDNPGNANN